MTGRTTIGGAVESLMRDGMPVRFTAYDGSAAGPPDAPVALHLRSERGLRYLLTAPGDLGMARAYVAGDLDLEGVHPGDPYDAMVLLKDHLVFRRPAPSEAVELLRGLGLANLRPPAPPPQEHRPRWRRVMEGLRHSLGRDAEVIAHHYDVSNRFYEMVLGPSMTYTCALYPTAEATLEEAQAAKYDLVCRKLALQPGQRLLDVGCGWGGMVRHAAREYGVRALGVTLSLQQAEWAKAAIDREGLGDLAEVRHLDYRDVMESGFDAVSSIGLTEHIGVRNYPAYFTHLGDRLRPGGRLLNHCITRSHNHHQPIGAFLDRYVFPDGELIGSGTIVAAARTPGSRCSTPRTSAVTTP
jgi:cyclopropane-fatty-acyl-phospholipid synthase